LLLFWEADQASEGELKIRRGLREVGRKADESILLAKTKDLRAITAIIKVERLETKKSRSQADIMTLVQDIETNPKSGGKFIIEDTGILPKNAVEGKNIDDANHDPAHVHQENIEVRKHGIGIDHHCESERDHRNMRRSGLIDLTGTNVLSQTRRTNLNPARDQ